MDVFHLLLFVILAGSRVVGLSAAKSWGDAGRAVARVGNWLLFHLFWLLIFFFLSFSWRAGSFVAGLNVLVSVRKVAFGTVK